MASSTTSSAFDKTSFASFETFFTRPSSFESFSYEESLVCSIRADLPVSACFFFKMDVLKIFSLNLKRSVIDASSEELHSKLIKKYSPR